MFYMGNGRGDVLPSDVLKPGNSDSLRGLEVKCPFSRPLPETVLDLSADYVIQCLVSILVCEVETWYLFYWKEEGSSLFVLRRPSPEFLEKHLTGPTLDFKNGIVNTQRRVGLKAKWQNILKEMEQNKWVEKLL